MEEQNKSAEDMLNEAENVETFSGEAEEVMENDPETAADSEVTEEAGSSEEAEASEADQETDGAEEGEDPEAETEAGTDGNAGGKKGFFGFKKKEKKDPRDEQIETLKAQLLRSQADFDNYRKRTEKDMDAKFDLGSKNVIEKILPVIDNFERALAMIPEEERESAFAEGLDKIYKQFTKLLEDMGVTPIDCVGKPFDPNLHNAVMQVPAEEGQEENIVVEEFQKGYIYKEYVVRYSMVKVTV